MTKPLFPVDDFEVGQKVLVGNMQGVIKKFSVDIRRALVKFHNQYGEYENWVDVDELTALHQDTPADAPSPIVEGEAIPPDAGGDLAGMTGHAPTGSDDVVADARGDLAGMTGHAPTGFLELRGMIAKLQADLLMMQEQVNDHDDYIDMQVEASFDEAERENEALLTRTEVAVLQVNAATLRAKHPLLFNDVMDDAEELSNEIPKGWEFVSSQVVSHVIGDEIIVYTYLTIKRDVPVFDWDGGKTDGAKAISEDTQRIPVELLQAED